MGKYVVGVCVFVLGYLIGKAAGKAQIARYVWNVLVNNRSSDMAGAVCLYMVKWAPIISKRNNFRGIDDAYMAIKSNRPLVDD